LVDALRKNAELSGIEIRAHTAVKGLIVEDDRVTGVETDAGRLSGENTVLATGAWTSLIKLGHSDIPLSVEPVRGQIISFATEPGRFRHVIHSRRGYIVPRLDGRVLAGSTTEKAGFAAGVTAEAVKGLQNMAAEISPFLNAEIEESWSGLRPFAGDGRPLLGRLPGIDGLTVATGHYRNGILLAPLTARLIADQMTGGIGSEYLRVFAVDRFRSRTAGSES
jgi:glycine oxidase